MILTTFPFAPSMTMVFGTGLVTPAKRLLTMWMVTCLATVQADTVAKTPKIASKSSITLRLSYGENSFAPYYYYGDEQQPMGVMLDVLRLALEDYNITFKAIDVPRKRLTEVFQNGAVDIDFMNPEWLPDPIPVVFSRPAIPYTETLFIHTGDQRHWRNKADLGGRTVCTHQSYIYGRVDDWVREGVLTRIDSRSEVTMIKMLAHRRCDAAIGNFYPFQWIAESLGHGHNIKPSGIEQRFAGISIMLHQKIDYLLEPLNRYIESRQYPKILEKHTKIHLDGLRYQRKTFLQGPSTQ